MGKLKSAAGVALFMTLLYGSSAYSQKVTTLKECLSYASTNNRNLKISGYDSRFRNERFMSKWVLTCRR